MYFPGAGTETTLEVNGVKGMRQLSIRTFRIYADEALVRFLAHWLVFGDAEAALNASFTNGSFEECYGVIGCSIEVAQLAHDSHALTEATK